MRQPGCTEQSYLHGYIRGNGGPRRTADGWRRRNRDPQVDDAAAGRGHQDDVQAQSLPVAKAKLRLRGRCSGRPAPQAHRKR